MSPETGEKRFVKKILPLLVALLLVKATPAEMLFLIMISVACALTANRIKGEE